MVEFQTGSKFRKTGSPIHGDAPLQSLHGVGEMTEELLVDAGYLSAADLVTADPVEVAAIDGISAGKAVKLVEAARAELGYWPSEDEETENE